MMKYLFLTSLLLLTACSELNPEYQACLDAMDSMTIKGAHDNGVAYLIGRKGEEIMSVSGYAAVRLLAPNSAWTMDHRPDRINLHIDCDGIVVATTAG